MAFDDMISVAKKQTTLFTNAQPFLRFVTIPRRKLSDDARANEAAHKIKEIITALTKPLTDQEKYAGKYELPKEPRVCFTGTLEDVQSFYEGDLTKYTSSAPHAAYTDGAPVMPPTEEGVKRMLAGTRHKPDEVIGKLLPLMGIATVEKVAINAVMAGCKPQYMPLCLALTECLTKFNIAEALQGAQGWFAFETLVCGPYAREIGLNSGGPGVAGPAPLTPGVPANTSIGRFVRLMQINIGGIEAGVNEAKGIGNPYKTSFVMAEDNEGSPWPQFTTHPDIGFKDRESTATMLVCWGDILSGYKATPEQQSSKDIRERVLSPVADAAKGLSRPQQGLIFHIGLKEAQNLAEAGYSKDDCRKWIWEHCIDTWAVGQKRGLGGGQLKVDFAIQGKPLDIDPRFNDKTLPPDTIVKYYPTLRHINIIVSLSSYLGAIQNGTPRWSAAIDKWR
jgi:hypothetical protein